MLDLIARYPFGVLVTCDTDGAVQATHLPMFAAPSGDGIAICGHVARANPHARAILEGAAATAIFTGPHAYVSAAWYEAPYATVPTWNYAAVHASGRLREGDPRAVLRALTEQFESGRERPWSIDGLGEDYLNNQLRGIAAFEMHAETLVASEKLSQNRTPADRERVIAELARSAREIERECAEAMRNCDHPSP